MAKSQAKVKKSKNLSSKLEKKIIIILISVVTLSLLFFATTRNLVNDSSLTNEKPEKIEDVKLNNNQEITQEKNVNQESSDTDVDKKLPPRKFPTDFPIYPDSQTTQESGNEVSNLLEMVTEDELSKVSDFYNTNLPTQGWNITNSTAISNAVIYEIKKRDEIGAVIISRIKGETKILVDIEKNPDDNL